MFQDVSSAKSVLDLQFILYLMLLLRHIRHIRHIRHMRHVEHIQHVDFGIWAPKESGESLGIAVPRPSSTSGYSAATKMAVSGGHGGHGSMVRHMVSQDAGYDLVTVTPTGIEARLYSHP